MFTSLPEGTTVSLCLPLSLTVPQLGSTANTPQPSALSPATQTMLEDERDRGRSTDQPGESHLTLCDKHLLVRIEASGKRKGMVEKGNMIFFMSEQSGLHGKTNMAILDFHGSSEEHPGLSTHISFGRCFLLLLPLFGSDLTKHNIF